MNQRLQIVALAFAALFGLQPALAALSCPMNAVAPCAPACGMDMSQMGMDCPMPHQAAGSGCVRDCCQSGVPLAVAHLSSGSKPRTIRTLFLIAAGDKQLAKNAAHAPVPADSLSAASPPRHILFQVFRV